MPLRMLRYYTDIRLAGHQGPIRQFLIYIGADLLTMPPGLNEPALLDYRYGLVDMNQVDCAGLLAQDNLVLAVLCDFGDRSMLKPQEIVAYIVRRLRELLVLGANERGFRDYMTMLEGLAENRDLRPQVKEAEHMLTGIDIECLLSFAIGFERGEKKGEKKGREEGEAQVVRRLLSRLGIAEASELLGLSVEKVERIATAGDDADSACGRH